MIYNVYVDGSYNHEEYLTYADMKDSSMSASAMDPNGKYHAAHGSIVILDENENILNLFRVTSALNIYTKGWSHDCEMLAVTSAFIYLQQKFELPGEYGKSNKIIVYHDNMGISEYVRPHGRTKWKAKPNSAAAIYVSTYNQIVDRLPCEISFVHTKGHSGIYWNEVADKIAKGTLKGNFNNYKIEEILI